MSFCFHSEHNIDFLRPCVAKNNYSTSHIDGTDERNKCFINEQRHHTLRTVYALQQQLRDLENSVIGLPSKSLTQKVPFVFFCSSVYPVIFIYVLLLSIYLLIQIYIHTYTYIYTYD